MALLPEALVLAQACAGLARVVLARAASRTRRPGTCPDTRPGEPRPPTGRARTTPHCAGRLQAIVSALLPANRPRLPLQVLLNALVLLMSSNCAGCQGRRVG